MPRRSSGASNGRGKRLRFPPTPPAPFPASPANLAPGLKACSNMASQTDTGDTGEPDPPAQPGLAEVLAAIVGCQSSLTALTTKVDAVQTDVGLIRQDMDKMRSRISSAEQRLGRVEDVVADHTAGLRSLHTKIKALEFRAEDAENRNRRNNLRIVGLAEGAEGRNPTEFIEHMLRSLLPAAQFSPFYAVERAHRIPPKPGPPGAPPRTFILKFLNFRDRDEVLRAARAQGALAYQNNTLLIFPDYSVETQKLRRSFDNVKAALRARGIRYGVLFPARLRVQDGETTKFFTSPADASAWLDTLPPHR